MEKIEKVTRWSQVAVLVSPSFGAGWYSWNRDHQLLLYHPKIVWMVERAKSNQIDDAWVEKNLGISNVYCGGAKDLIIHWLPVGTRFKIDEYDGSESVRTLSELVLIA